jgi:mono/diheme cytochrome c family protein
MTLKRSTTLMRTAVLVIAALLVVALAVITSEPFRKMWAPSEVAHEAPPAAGSSETEMAAAKEKAATDDKKAASDAGECCKAGDTTPPLELVKRVSPGGLHSPYPDYMKMAKDDPDTVKQFRLPGCNECHGGGGGGGFCPALSQGVWFWGNTDDVLFRLITLGSAALEKEGFTRYQYGTIKGPMPAMGFTVPTSDQLWKIIAFIRSINPPGTNPPEKLIPGKHTPLLEGELE